MSASFWSSSAVRQTRRNVCCWIFCVAVGEKSHSQAPPMEKIVIVIILIANKKEWKKKIESGWHNDSLALIWWWGEDSVKCKNTTKNYVLIKRNNNDSEVDDGKNRFSDKVLFFSWVGFCCFQVIFVTLILTEKEWKIFSNVNANACVRTLNNFTLDRPQSTNELVLVSLQAISWHIY